MTTIQDTPETVEAMASRVEATAGHMLAEHAIYVPKQMADTAAMLRRLHARAVDAESYTEAVNREAGKLLVKHEEMKEAFATARVALDAAEQERDGVMAALTAQVGLAEAAGYARGVRDAAGVVSKHRDEEVISMSLVEAAILALPPKEN
jgi:hypothetical protein